MRMRMMFGAVAAAVGVSMAASDCGATDSAMIHGGAVVVLDSSSQCALDLSGAHTLNISGGVLRVNSNSACAACDNGTPELNVAALYVVGGSCMESDTYNGPTISPAAAHPDPLAHLPVPPNGPTRSSPPSSGAHSILPGYFPNGIVKSSGSLAMAPGLYVVEGVGNFGGFQVTGGNLTGLGVMVYIKSGKLDLGGSGNITLTPPNPIDYAYVGADTYEDLIIFQARDNSTESRVICSNNFNVEGTTYLPNNLHRLGGTGDGLGNQIIARSLSVFGTGTLTINYTGIHPGTLLCEADVNGSFAVNMDDLLAVINAWGPCMSSRCAADIDGDGHIGINDLMEVIDAWGGCP